MTDSKLASGQPYELFMFARKHGLTIPQARKILDEFGADRPGADAAAKALLERDLDNDTGEPTKLHRRSVGLWEEAVPAAAVPSAPRAARPT